MKQEYKFERYSENEAKEFLSEFPSLRVISSLHKPCRTQWDGSNPTEHWTAINYERINGAFSPYYSLERDLSVVGGYDRDFFLAKIESLERVEDKEANALLDKLFWQKVSSGGEKRTLDIGGKKAKILFATNLSVRTKADGELYLLGDCWGNGRKYFHKQLAGFTGRFVE